MPQDRPTAAELLEAVREFLEGEVMTSPDQKTAFLGRVAANAVAIVAREIALGPEADAAEAERLRALLASDEADLRALNMELARRIREGTIDRDEAVAHLRATVRDKLRIANPRYIEA